MQRLHPVSPVFLLATVAYQMIYPLLGVFAWSSYQSQWLLYGALALMPVVALWRYLFFRFSLDDDDMVVVEGLIFRKNRKIPYARIQNINTAQNPLHRLLGVATVQLESASGNKPEAVLRVVDGAVIDRLRQKVQAAHVSGHFVTGENVRASSPAAMTTPGRQPDEAVIVHMPLADVLRYGLVSQKGFLVFALLSGFFGQNVHWFQGMATQLARWGWLPHWSDWSHRQMVVFAVAMVVLVFLLLQFFTMAWAVLRFYDFCVWRKPGRLFVEMGLFSRATATIPVRRIQRYRLSENPLHRFFGGATVTVETAGGVHAEQEGLLMPWLAPYMSREKVAGLLSTIEPAVSWQDVSWRRLPFCAWRRIFKRLLVFWLLLVGLVALLLGRETETPVWWAVGLFLAGWPVLFWYARAWVRQAGYVLDDVRFGTRHGVFFRQQNHVRLNKAQVISVHQSPFDRRHGMATVKIDTAGGHPLGSLVAMPYLPVAEVRRIRERVLQQGCFATPDRAAEG